MRAAAEVARTDCNRSLTMRYDGKSLRDHDEYIRRDQTGGARECNEGLRYLWRACHTPAGALEVQTAARVASPRFTSVDRTTQDALRFTHVR